MAVSGSRGSPALATAAQLINTTRLRNRLPQMNDPRPGIRVSICIIRFKILGCAEKLHGLIGHVNNEV
jgi:hypothetical protein